MSDAKKTKGSKPSIDTRLVHGSHHSTAWNFTNHVVPPMTSNTTYRLESVERGAQGFLNFGDEENKDQPIWVYDRLDEPNNLMLEEQLAYLEKGESAVTFSSGMGAISAVCLASLKSGDLVLSDPTIYGCTYSLFSNWLPKFNLNVEWKDSQKDNFLKDPPQNLRLIYLESVANPNLKIAPLKQICERVSELNQKRSEDRKILVAVDNTFATPIGCNPISLGADFAIQSLTKNIAGFGTELGGAVICPKAWNIPMKVARKDFGAVLNSKSSWHILNHGVPTLNLRFKKQQENARLIAKHLSENKGEIESVIYPGLETFSNKQNALDTLTKDENGELNSGFMIAFTLKGDNERTKKFVNFLAKESYSITLAVSLGLTKTLVEVPRLMTHSSLDDSASEVGDISEKLIRLSVGIENAQDIINDLESAFKHINSAR